MKAVLMLAAAWLHGGAMNDSFYQDFRGGKFRETVLKRFGPTPAQFMKGEAEGLRITLPAQAKPIGPVGIASSLAVHGDFEITATYEILMGAKPRSGYGLGVSLHVVADTPSFDNATVARFNHPGHGDVYATDRGHYTGDGKDVHAERYAPTNAQRGKLRLARSGSTLKYLAAGLDEEEFQEVRTAAFVDRPLKEVRITADTGNSAEAVDVRIKDLRIRADALSASLSAVGPRSGWIGWTLGLAVGVAVLGGGTLTWWRVRRDAKAAT